MKPHRIVLIGAGNVATHLADTLFKKGFSIVQIYSRTEQSAKALSEQYAAPFITDIQQIERNADIYVYALKDDAIAVIAKQNPAKKGLHLHTAGSVPMTVFAGLCENYGVIYPLQSFSKNRPVNFEEIPVFIEANTSDNLDMLWTFAKQISKNVQETDSEKRKLLHLSAVFACNFVNHLCVIAEKISNDAQISFENLLPLIQETVAKLHALPPLNAQTGPAVRRDKLTMAKHIDLLKQMPQEQKIYKLISENIMRGGL